MEIKKLFLDEVDKAEGLIIVIDVLRAFTTAAFAFFKKAKEIILVKETSFAFEKKKEDPTLLLMGEKHTFPIKGFDFGNSPYLIEKENLKDKTLVFRTTSGTKGVVEVKDRGDPILASSFVVANATLRRIKDLNPKIVSFIITGANCSLESKDSGDEDLSLAEYIEAKLFNADVDPKPFLQRVIDSSSAKRFLEGQYKELLKEDVEKAIDLDRFDFSLQVFKRRGDLILRSIK